MVALGLFLSLKKIRKVRLNNKFSILSPDEPSSADSVKKVKREKERQPELQWLELQQEFDLL